MSGRCLYLVSSSASREYVLDCVEALALPRGMVHHFRYLTKYIDDRLRTSLATNAGHLARQLDHVPVVVVYLSQSQSGGKWMPAPMGYLPVRCGTLLEAFRDGDVAHFFFAAADYIRPTRGSRSARALLNANVSFRVSSGATSSPSFAHLAGHLTLEAPRSLDSRAFQQFVTEAYKPSEWRTRSSGSAPLDVVYDVIFFRVAGVFRERNDRLVEVKPTPRPLLGNPLAEYELETGVTYHIKVTTHLSARLPAQLPGHGRSRLRLSFDPELITPVGPTSFRISSTYDLQYWSILATGQANQRSVLAIGCDDDSPVDHENFARRELLCPEISLPVSFISRNRSHASRAGTGRR